MKSLELCEYRISCIRATKPSSIFTKVAQTQGLEKQTGTWDKNIALAWLEGTRNTHFET